MALVITSNFQDKDGRQHFEGLAEGSGARSAKPRGAIHQCRQRQGDHVRVCGGLWRPKSQGCHIARCVGLLRSSLQKRKERKSQLILYRVDGCTDGEWEPLLTGTDWEKLEQLIIGDRDPRCRLRRKEESKFEKPRRKGGAGNQFGAPVAAQQTRVQRCSVSPRGGAG